MYKRVIIRFDASADIIIDDMLWLYAAGREVSSVTENLLLSMDCPRVASSSRRVNMWSKCAHKSAFSWQRCDCNLCLSSKMTICDLPSNSVTKKSQIPFVVASLNTFISRKSGIVGPVM